MRASRLIADRYEPIKLIDQGGMGDVFQARDIETDEIVAIKFLKPDVVADDPALVQRFEREAEALRQLHHPNIVSIYATGEQDEVHYIVMEFVSGGSLAQLLQREAQLPIERVLMIALDLADALTRAHRLKIIHRDLKPANVLLANDGSPRLTDFGVAYLDDRNTRMTQTGSLLGTLAYLSPEVCSGGGYDERSDIWAFGILLFEMLTGERPFLETTPAGTITAIMTKPTPDLSQMRADIPMELANLVYWMLAKNPLDRVPSVRTVGAELETILRRLSERDAISSEVARAVPPEDESRFATTPIRPANLDQLGLGQSPLDSQVQAALNQTNQTPTAGGSSLPQITSLSSSLSDVLPRRRVTAPRVVISYRRDDTGAITSQIFDQLASVLGASNVVRDADRIADRTVTRLVIASDIVESYDAMVVVIGPQWAAGGALNNPKFHVRMEIEAALRRPDMVIIPLLVDGATLPRPEDLPASLQPLLAHNAFQLNSHAAVAPQVARLINQIKRTLNVRRVLWRRPVVLAVIGVLIALLIFSGALMMSGSQLPLAANAPGICGEVEPAEPDHYMVLVADLEPIQTEARDVARFIADDLRQNLEVAAPFSRINIRRCPAVLTSTADAQAAAEAVGASVIVWGNYTEALIDVAVEIGTLAGFPNNEMPRVLLEETVNVRIRLQDERQQSVAVPALSALTALQNADGDGYEVARSVTVLAALTGDPGEIVGSSIAAQVVRALWFFVNDTETTIAHLDDAIQVRAGNPILFAFRGAAYHRVGRLDEARRDLQTAQRLGESMGLRRWALPHFLLGNDALFRDDLDTALAEYSRVIELRPDDWFGWNYRGAIHYLRGEFEPANADLLRAIELGPDTNFPFPFATLIALREGRISDARALMNTVITEFPDPSFSNRMIDALYGPDTPLIWGLVFSAFTNQLLGQHDQVIADTTALINVNASLADAHLMQGVAYCNLRDYAAAEIAYTAGLEIEPDYLLIAALRGETRRARGDLVNALADAARVTADDATTAELIALVEDPNASCENFFDLDSESS
ncbi:MAG: protein kinase [Chloroflexi bacterium]|nr:protein kinase [Chloroflexota bacterium]